MTQPSANPASFSYVIDEKQLSQKLGSPIPDPIRVFSLEGLGVDRGRFLDELGPTFADLPWDIYDLKLEQIHFLARCFPSQKKTLDEFYDEYFSNRATLADIADDILAKLSPERHRQFDELEPFRRRSIARFNLASAEGSWSVQRVPVPAFAQEVSSGDYRSHKRIFEEAADQVTAHPEFQRLMVALVSLAASLRAGARAFSMTMHQVSIVADADTFGDNSPEGIHKDGADFIVSALVMAREGVQGGQSIVYGPDKQTEYLRIELQAGQGIFQADANSTLWHDVTPVKLAKLDPANPEAEGKRNIFGFDIDVVG